MNLSTQLRIILLLVGAAIWLAIYLFGKRKTTQPAVVVAPAATEASPIMETTPGFSPAEDLDDDEFETPAYMRRQGQREPRQDYEPRIANAHDYVDMDEVRDDDRLFSSDERDQPQLRATYTVQEPALAQSKFVHEADDFEVSAKESQHESIDTQEHFDQPVYVDTAYVEPAPEVAVSEPVTEGFASRREPTITFDEFEVADSPVAAYQEPEPVENAEPEPVIEAEPPTLPNIPVVEHPVDTAHGYSLREDPVATSLAISPAPTLSEAVPAPVERPAVRSVPATTPDAASATNASKPANTAARRKIIALRIPMPERVAGAQLLPLLQGERLQHGKFSIFHRMQGAGTVFSVASMVEPGTFDPQAMSEQQFPGVTLFMLLPGPVDGLIAYDQMLSCAQRIAHATSGVLQDERGSKLTQQAMDRLRDEVLDFQHLIGGMATAT